MDSFLVDGQRSQELLNFLMNANERKKNYFLGINDFLKTHFAKKIETILEQQDESNDEDDENEEIIFSSII